MLNITPQARIERHRAHGYEMVAQAASAWHDIRDLAAVQQAAPSAKSSFIMQYLAFLTLVASLLLASMFPAAAQQRIINPGDAVVTGFSGIAPNGMAFGPGVDPLDGFFINLDGPSAQIMSLGGVEGAARGQLVAAPALFQLTARQIGQVFAAALDDGLGGKTPNIYLGATSAFGIHIAMPDSNGDGLPERLKTGNANARWMPGQFGPGAEPGAIWRVNGENGAVEQFTTLPGNSGPGVGDVVFDARHRQFFASDVDTGLIYRIGESGNIIDSFDHGLNGRPNQGLAPVGDDGVMMDITSPAFDTQDPATWGYTQSERQVWGMAVHGGRLYYALKDGLQVWSVGIARGGRFVDDARWELDAKELPASGAITDMAFDKAGRLYLAQRGSPRGSYDYSVFATPGRSSVARYTKETPDNPATPGKWKPVGEGYAIGMTPPHLQANGGLALGYAHGATGAMRARSCSATLWATGSRLISSGGVGPGAGAGAEADVHGLQSTPLNKVGLANVPPANSYFVDYDGVFGDAAKAGHMGDIEIWQPCNRGFTRSGALPPGYVPPAKVPPQDFPPDYPPPHREFTTNLKLTKRAAPKTCTAYMGGWACRYQVRVRNMGPEAYFGPILINDTLPSAPAGAIMGFAPAASWNCWAVGAASYNCHRPGVFLAPGASVELTVYVGVPHDYPKCQVQNIASLTWAPGGTRWNTDPTDDVDSATALIPSANCPPPEGKTNLKIEKEAAGQACENMGNFARCLYRITVTNAGANVYHGEIHVTDQPPAGTTAIFGAGLWSCVGGGGVYDCAHPDTSLNPGEQRFLWVFVDAPMDVVRQQSCKIKNWAKITFAPGGSAQNTNPADDADSATAFVNASICHVPRTILKSFNCPPGYTKSGNRCVQKSGRCPIGWSKTPVRGKCCPAGKPWNGQSCGRQTTETPPTRQPPRREPPGYTPPTYVPPSYTPPTRKLCPRGTYGIYPRCRPNRTPPKVCPQGTHGIYPRCIPNRTTPQFCPQGTTGIYPLCIPTRQPPQACPKGYHGKPPRCIRDTKPPQQCPQGMRGKAPNCYPITEPGGNSTTNPGTNGNLGRFPGLKRPGLSRPGLKRPAVKWPGVKRPNGKRPGFKRPGLKRPSFRLPKLGNRKGTTPGLRRPSRRRPNLKRVPNFRAPLTRTPGTKGKTIYNPNLRKSKTRNTNGRKKSYRKTAPRSSNTLRLRTLKPKRSIRHKLNLGRSSKRSAPRARTLSRSAAARRNVRGNTRKPAVRTQRKVKKKSKKVLRLRLDSRLLGQ